jgi:hypothetical protein
MAGRGVTGSPSEAAPSLRKETIANSTTHLKTGDFYNM